MKIAMIGHKRIPSREGGVEVVVEELSARMAALGHSVHVYNRRDGRGCRERKREYRGVRLIAVPTPAARCLNAFVYSLLATLRALPGGYDVIHYHAEGPAAMLWIPRLLGIRTVCTIHGLDWQRGKWGGFASRYLLFGEKIAARKAHELVVLSRNMQGYFCKTYGREAGLIPNAVVRPRNPAPNIIAGKHGLEKDGYILFLARLSPEKGLHYLLEAFSRLNTPKGLVVAGEGAYGDGYARRVAQLAARDGRVILAGLVQGEELEKLLSNCFLYVLPSDVEGMSLSLLEAMSHGCRCLVSDIPENTEVAGEYARTFSRSDVGSLQAALEDILCGRVSFPESRQIADYCLSRFSWDDITEKYLALYRG